MKNFNFLLAAVAALLLFSCGKKENNPNLIRVGVMSGPEYGIAETAKQVAKDKYDLDVELIAFNDYVIPNEALNQGELDVNAYQTKPFMDEQIKQRGYKLAVVGNTFVYPIVGYSKKIKSLDELKNGSTIVIPNDPANGGRSLLLIEKQGLIKLKPGVGLFPKLTDVVENPKKLEIIELEGPQLPRVLDDEKVSIAVINNNFAGQAGLDPNKNGVFIEDKDSPYVNLIVSRIDNNDEEKIQKFLKAYQSAEVAEKAKTLFKGGAIQGW